MKYFFAGVFLSFFTATILAASAGEPAIIPAPQKIALNDGVFRLMPDTAILLDVASHETAHWLHGQINKATGYPLDSYDSDRPIKAAILMTTNGASASLGEEGYELLVKTNGISIRANTQAGLFYGAQTLLQLFPTAIYSNSQPRLFDWTIPCVRIEDQPRFKWRGFMLDVSRHFFTKTEIMRLLDLLAMHKINTFHWHLVDDQGWRIEIKKYPQLTKIGAWRSGVGFGLDPKSTTAYGRDGRYGGYYQQEDIREIVHYAADLHITIVPEIEMPGHSSAALAACPQFSCSGGPYTTPLVGGVFNGIYCAGKEETFAFLQDVLTEVMDLFPGKYIHIGGDETPKDNWHKCPLCQARMKKEGLKDEHELQSYFVRRIEKFINSKGRNLVGWSEIAEGGLAQNAVVMDWIGGGREAAGAGHDVVMTPQEFCYLDHYQSRDRSTEPRAIGGFLPLNKIYSFEPVPTNLPPQFEARILGAQGNLWTEYIPSMKQAQYMIFPRMSALAEVGWSSKASRDFDDFSRRLQIQFKRFDQLGVNYRRTSVTAPESNPPK